MRVEIRDGPGLDIAGDADFERDIFVAQAGKQVGIVDGVNTVADAFGTDGQGIDDRLRPGGFARVAGEPKPGVPGVTIRLAEEVGGAAMFVAADTE